MRLDFTTGMGWDNSTAKVIDLKKAQRIYDVFWIDLEKGELCYGVTINGKMQFDPETNDVQKQIIKGRFKVELIGNEPDEYQAKERNDDD